jgi:putative ABC transport system permease protein
MCETAHPLGKIFFEHNQTTPLTVVAVCKDFPENCSLKNGVYFMLPEDRDSEWSYISYLEISAGAKDKILSGLNTEVIEQEKSRKRRKMAVRNDGFIRYSP